MQYFLMHEEIEYLQDFQNGADIWSYNYKG